MYFTGQKFSENPVFISRLLICYKWIESNKFIMFLSLFGVTQQYKPYIVF